MRVAGKKIRPIRPLIARGSTGQNRYVIEALEPRFLLASTPIKFAVIADYGLAGQPELDVANLVKSWNPEFIATLGDNNYDNGSAATIDANIGQYYHDYIYNYHGSYGAGSPTRRFFPAMGNHDYGAQDDDYNNSLPYRNYFDLPGNERYYDYAVGPVHFFAIDSDENEPDGNDYFSIQGQWLQSHLASATEPFKVVYFHHPAYSSGGHGQSPWMQWPFQQWGASVVMAGHDHIYDRLSVGGLTYFVNGIGGAELTPTAAIDPASQYRYAGEYGAMLVNATDTSMTFQMYLRDGSLIDTYTISPSSPRNTVTLTTPTPNAAEPSTAGHFTLTRTGSTASALAVSLLIGGSATNGSDYTTVPSVVTIPAGAASLDIPITPIDDAVGEPDETVSLTIVPSNNYNFATSWTGTVNIADNDTTRSTLIPVNSTWKYRDTGSNQGTAWRAIGFNDSAWASGPAQLGYGEGDEATVVSYGSNPLNKYITTYFRQSFNIANPAAVAGLNISLLRDDGAIVYINGVEVVRSNMPTGTVDYLVKANSNVTGAEESTFFSYPIAASMLVAGANVIAVEIHQSAEDSTDVSFSLKMDVLVDDIAPASPSVPNLVSTVANDTGISQTDDLTFVTTPQFSGTAETGSTVKLFSDNVQVGSAVAIGGAWQITSAALGAGPHQIKAQAVDAAGNVGPLSAALNVTIDFAAPTVSVGTFLFEKNHSITFQFNEDVSAMLGPEDLSVRKQGDPNDLSTTSVTRTYATDLATFTFPSPLASGTYDAKLTTAGVTDAAGNALAGDGAFAFFFQGADGDRNGKVQIEDFNRLATNFGKALQTFTQGNYDYGADGKVDILDFNILATAFGKSVTVPASRQSIPAGPTIPGIVATDEDHLVDILE